VTAASSASASREQARSPGVGEHGRPLALDAHDRPAFARCLFERLFRPGRVVELALRVVVEHEQAAWGPLDPSTACGTILPGMVDR
jgi:hypothetical protein